MLEKGITFEHLVSETGLNRGTIHNVLSGACSSVRARQALTNALGVQLWPAVEVETTRATIAENTVFLRLTHEQAEDLHKKFPTTTRIVPQSPAGSLGPYIVEFLADTPAIVTLKNPDLPRPQGAPRYSSLPEPLPSTETES